MANYVNGVVDNSYDKQKTSKAGKPFTIHYIDVDGITISTGFKRMFEIGQMCDIEVEDKYGEWQYKGPGNGTQTVTTAAPVKQPRSSGGGSGFTKKASNFPINPTDGQISIIRQSSLKTATEAVEVMMNHNLVVIGTEDEFIKKVLEVALVFTDFGSGQDIMKMAAAAQANLQAVK